MSLHSSNVAPSQQNSHIIINSGRRWSHVASAKPKGQSQQPSGSKSKAQKQEEEEEEFFEDEEEFGEFDEEDLGEDGFLDEQELDDAALLGLDLEESGPGVDTAGVSWGEMALAATQKVLKSPAMGGIELYLFK